MSKLEYNNLKMTKRIMDKNETPKGKNAKRENKNVKMQIGKNVNV